MQQIGLYVHRLRVFENHVRQELGSAAGQFDLRGIISDFINHFTDNMIEGDDRRSRLDRQRDDDSYISGNILYGSTGIASEIVNPDTEELRYERAIEDVERIPLYFGFYTPDGEDTWYFCTQSFGGRSCSSTFNSALQKFFSERRNETLTIQKVMPTDEQALAGHSVQKVTLIRRRVPSDEFQEQIGDLAREVKVSMSISVDGRGPLGVYEDFRDRMAEREDAALVIDGVAFEQATATVRIGRTYKKVGLIGPSNTAGVVDLSDAVERDEKTYPVFGSIDQEAEQVCSDYLVEFRDQ